MGTDDKNYCPTCEMLMEHCQCLPTGMWIHESNAVEKEDLRKILKKWNQYEWSGEQDSLYIDLKKLLNGGE